MSDEGRLVAGRYRIVRRLGTGAMGAVWQAQDEVLHRTVAIKQLLLQPGLDGNEAEDARQRTMREGRIAARLHHPNAISVFDVVTDDNGQPCLIMEYLESTSLAQVLQNQGTLDPIEVARIGAQVASALKEAHAVGIVHRDIKPGNILLAPNGLVKITDFGISRAKDDVTVTKTGMIAGTPAYLAPEVAIGGDPGPESDVFSLGSTLYAATEGQPPFGLSENTLSLLHAVAAGQINPPRQSGPLASVLAVLLHPDVRHRPTAEQSEQLLAAVARGETPLGGPVEDATRFAPAAGLGAAAGAGAALAADDVPAGHSGTLDPGEPYYGSAGEDDYETAVAGYPPDDYDSRGPHATRAVPAGAYADHGGYESPDDYADGDYDGYDGYDDEPPPEEPAKRSGWKLPAAAGSVVVLGLAAFAIWLSNGHSGGDAEEGDPNRQQPVGSSSSTQLTTTTVPSTTSEVVDEPVRPVDTEESSSSRYVPPAQPEPEPEPTQEPEPEPEPEPTKTTTSEPEPTTTTQQQPTTSGTPTS
ncbi:serine/threonine protein kinase [Prauserella shujinwangii]|uniref:non-specific serine/threonine protein kinase n=1 Tax=Prauserella shujinwangii TaxID=1453103 RepID=A0A2T0LLW7_9PSEU|nr:serine/threonine-protein kinase [Prauserella shujinwangii]PRX44034.1 serine/threonine protein kinase [Prauserella shujinwangii]